LISPAGNGARVKQLRETGKFGRLSCVAVPYAAQSRLPSLLRHFRSWRGVGCAFDEASFCTSIHSFLAKGNADNGRMVDVLARNDGMTASCETRTVEFKKSVALSAAELAERWGAIKQREWDAIHRADRAWATIVSEGWKVVAALKTLDGQEVRLTVDCR
jgi:hypothetical protein